MSSRPVQIARPRRSDIRRTGRRRLFGRRRGSGRRARWSWRKRLIVGAGALVVLAAVAVGGAFWYAHWRYDQIDKQAVAGLTPRVAGQPFDMLLVGSDSRAFVNNSTERAEFGDEADAGGDRSDVIIIARIVPATHRVKLLSIPRDTWVDIPTNSGSLSGPNRINAAFDTGPGLLVKTITRSFHIPINDYAKVNFPGFSDIVNSLGGIGLDFKYPVRDPYSGLDITRVGCQTVNGAQALALVRSRHLSYFEDGEWQYDGGSDWSRIQRQDAFFRAVATRAAHAVSDPLTLNDLVGATAGNLTIDQTLSEGDVVSLARIFKDFSSAELATETLPTEPTTIDGADVLLPAPSEDAATISSFLAFGTTTAHTTAAASVASDGSEGSRARRAPVQLTSVQLTSVQLTSVTVTTLPGTPAVNPADVVTNTQPEPWNPTPCTP